MTPALGPVGIWAPLRFWAENPAAAEQLEDLGFPTIWVGNGVGMLNTVEDLLTATDNLVVATGIVNIRRNPVSPTEAAATYARHHRRMLLGLGNGWAPGAGASPYTEISRYLDELDATGAVPASGRVLAALGPRMLTLAAARSAGAHPFLTTPEHTHQARHVLGTGPLLAPEQKVVLEIDPSLARDIARNALDFYLTKGNYAYALCRLGFTESDLVGGGSDRLVDRLVAWGPPHAIRRRIDEHRQAGADHVAVQVLSAANPGDSFRRLSEVLLG